MIFRFPKRSLALLCPLLVAVAVVASAQYFRYGMAPEEVEAAYFEKGDYANCLQICNQATRYQDTGSEWEKLALRSMREVGLYEDAATRALDAAERFPKDFELLVLAERALREGGQVEEAAKVLTTLNEAAKSADRKKLNAEQLTALGQTALLLGAEPKLVLGSFFTAARKLEPEYLPGHLAAAELSLEKRDYALAEKTLLEAQKALGERVDILYGLARTYFPTDRERAQSFLERLLAKNPSYVPALLLNAEHAIDTEKYDTALEVCALIHQTNPEHPMTWATEAAVHYIRDDTQKADAARERALAHWDGNPRIDHFIGTKISQKRRFEEGVSFQRKALEKDPGYIPAKAELGQDLLRLGQNEEGWRLIEEVQKADGYNVTAFNMMKLHDHLQGFETLERGNFVLRLPTKEAALYGQRALDLLEEAEKVLGEKYGYRPKLPVAVEFFPEQQDFAIRTLGMPGGLGLLGACFGAVVTMNSPGSLVSGESNWESTLWHEFCHTITLGATRHRIPRWLTEGISVYEEALRNPACGHRMNPTFRDMILDEEHGPIPLAELSAALLAYNDPQFVNFAYFQARQVVEFLIDTYGQNTVRDILVDLSKGLEMDAILGKRCARIDLIDKAFAEYSRKQALALAPKLDWEEPEEDSPLRQDPVGIAAYLKSHPTSFWALTAHCKALVAEEKWADAVAPAEKLVALYPGYDGPDNGHYFLALAHRNQGNLDAEREALLGWAQASGDAPFAYQRLMEIDREQENWASLAQAAEWQLAINPLLDAPHRALAYAGLALEKEDAARSAFENVLLLDPVDPAEIHFQLGRLNLTHDPPAARRHILEALEESPRFREAHKLLLQINANATTADVETTSDQ